MSPRGSFSQEKRGSSSSGQAGAGSGSRPPQIGQAPHHVPGGVAPGKDAREALVPVSLGEPPAVAGQQQGRVAKLRHGIAQQPVQQDLPGGGGEQIPAPHHLGDAHSAVVSHHRQLIGVHAVAAPQDEVPAASGQVLGLGAVMEVRKGDGFLRHPQPQRRGAGAAFLRHLLWGQVPAGPVVQQFPVRSVGRAGRVELGPAAEAGVHPALCLQLFQLGAVEGEPLALVVRGVGDALVPALVPEKP